MKALLLADGCGTQISRRVGGSPKYTVDLGNGMPLILYTIRMLRRKGIREIAVVTGYRHESLEKLLAKEDVRFYYNPVFDATDSIASAWFALEFLSGDDLLIMNAEVFCEEALFERILKEPLNPAVFYDTSRYAKADDGLFCENRQIRKYGKELSPEEINGKSMGIVRMSHAFLPLFVRRLTEMIQAQEYGMQWENVLCSMTEKFPAYACDVVPAFWARADDIEGRRQIRKFVQQAGGGFSGRPAEVPAAGWLRFLRQAG